MTERYSIMATPSRADAIIDAANEARIDDQGRIQTAQHILHNARVSLNALAGLLDEAENAVAGRDGRGEPGPIFLALEALRDEPAIRRARWDGETERRRQAVSA